MNIKDGLICLLIVAVSSLSTFNGAATAHVSKLTPDNHSNYPVDARMGQQTYLLVTLNSNATMVTTKAGQSVYLHGVLSSGAPPATWRDSSHGIPDVTVNLQCMNPDGDTWTTVDTIHTNLPNDCPTGAGTFTQILTPEVEGANTYRVTYDGDSQYAPAVSNMVTLAVLMW